MTNILVIDDDPEIRKAATLVLQEDGYDVLCATDGRAGKAILHESDVDIVITDIFMPEQDGLQTIMEIRQHWPSVRIIAISGSGEDDGIDYLRHARLLGAKFVLAKPFNAAQLLSGVLACMAPSECSEAR